MENTYWIWHTPRIKSIRNGGVQETAHSIEDANKKFNAMLAWYDGEKDFTLQEVDLSQYPPAAEIRLVNVFHARSKKLWYQIRLQDVTGLLKKR